MIGQTTNILTFPRSQTVISQAPSDRLAQRKVKSVLERSLFLKLYLEKGIVKPWYEDRLSECQKHYPNYSQELDKLEKEMHDNGNGSQNWEWFKLLRGLADVIHNSLSHSNITENLFEAELQYIHKNEAMMN